MNITLIQDASMRNVIILIIVEYIDCIVIILNIKKMNKILFLKREFKNMEGRLSIVGQETVVNHILVSSYNLNRAIPGDKVKLRIMPDRSGYVEEILERSNQLISGILEIKSQTIYGMGKKGGRYYLFRPSDPMYPSFVVLSRVDTKKYSTNIYVVIRFLHWEENAKYPSGSCEFIIGEIGNFHHEARNRLYYRGLSSHDNERPLIKKSNLHNIIKARIDQLEKERSNRLDLTNNYILSIDPVGCKDIDDALSSEVCDDHYILGIHIADVSYWVQPDSDLDKQGFKRMTSIYGPHGNIHMLPNELSEHHCSLLKDQERLAVSLFVKMDKTGNIISSYFVPSIIKNKEQLSYEQADSLINTKHPQLSQLFHIISLMKSNYAMPLASPSHYMIEKSMILANALAAEHIINKYGKSILRIHTAPNSAIVPGYRLDPKLIAYLKTRLYNSATYHYYEGTDSPHMHFGLGMQYYTHFTSPIRRYTDIINHRLIKGEITMDDVTFNKMVIEANRICTQVKRFDKDIAYLNLINNLTTEITAEAYIIEILQYTASIKIYLPQYQLSQKLIICHSKLQHLYEFDISPAQLKLSQHDEEPHVYNLYDKISVTLTAIPKKDTFNKKLRIQVTGLTFINNEI